MVKLLTSTKNVGQDSSVDGGETGDANTTIKSKTGCEEGVIGLLGLDAALGWRRVRDVLCCTGLSRVVAWGNDNGD